MKAEGSPAPDLPIYGEAEQRDRAVEAAVESARPVFNCQKLRKPPQTMHQVARLDEPEIIIGETVGQRVGVDQTGEQSHAAR